MFIDKWEDGGFIEMVADFENINLSKREYEETTLITGNWYEERRRWLKEALESDKYQGIAIHLASYVKRHDRKDKYNSHAFVLLEVGGQLYEIVAEHGLHDSLEGRWIPLETTCESLLSKLETDKSYPLTVYAEPLKEVINQLQMKGFK
jgi:hypothetical protein